MRCNVVEIPLLVDLCSAVRIREDHRVSSDFETVIYHPTLTFAIPGPKKKETCRRSVMHLNLISVVD